MLFLSGIQTNNHIEDNDIIKILDILKDSIEEPRYIHAFNDKKLYVVLKDKWFECSLHKDNTWDKMWCGSCKGGKALFRIYTVTYLEVFLWNFGIYIMQTVR